LTGTTWRYLKVKYQAYMAMTTDLAKWPATSFGDFLDRLMKDSKKQQGVLIE